jgi:lipopolysaccharide biosynthesis glycosyltransferase
MKKVEEKKQQPFKIYIGYDERESIAFDVCAYSIQKHATVPIEIIKLDKQRMKEADTYKRPEKKGDASTDFAYTRFFIPHLSNYKGFSLFMDCDMIMQCDIKEIIDLCDKNYAVRVVKHPQYTPVHSVKMDGQKQEGYPRKNWSSVILWNNEHQYNRLLTPDLLNDVKKSSGAYLHRFSWLADTAIGSLPATMNYLCDEKLYPTLSLEQLKIIHYTNGGPWFTDREECIDCEYNYVWEKYKFEMEGGREISTGFFASLTGVKDLSSTSPEKPSLSITELSNVKKIQEKICVPCRRSKKR